MAQLAAGLFGGYDVALTRRFPCPMPTHRGEASLWLDDNRTGTWKLCCWCQRQTYWTLAEVRASLAYGSPMRLKEIAAAVWWRRLAWELGLTEPVPINLPAMADAPVVVQAVRDGIELLIGLRWIDHPGQPVAFARSFATAWCGGFFSPTEVYRAILTLADAGVITNVGTDTKSRSYLWMPGPAANPAALTEPS